jgi:hypothetical protein
MPDWMPVWITEWVPEWIDLPTAGRDGKTVTLYLPSLATKPVFGN